MKKVLIAFTSLLFVTYLNAQQTSFGIKGGLNLSSVDVKNANDYDTKPGLHLGGLAHIHVSKHFAVQPELLYSMQGGENGNVKLNLNYINFPVLAQFMINNGFRLQTGPQISFLVSAESKVGDIEVDVDDEISSVDFSWVFGASYLFNPNIGIDTRFNVGISNISELNNVEARNRVFQVGLFYQFSK